MSFSSAELIQPLLVGETLGEDETRSMPEDDADAQFKKSLAILDSRSTVFQRTQLFRGLMDFFWLPSRVGLVPALYGLLQAVCAMLSLTSFFYESARLEFWLVLGGLTLYLSLSTWYLFHLQNNRGIYVPKTSTELLSAFFREHPPNSFMVSYEWKSGGDIAEAIAKILPNTWIDVEQLLPGASVTRSCRRAARDTQVGIVVMTPEYLMSRNCRLELSVLKLHDERDGAARLLVFVEPSVLRAYHNVSGTRDHLRTCEQEMTAIFGLVLKDSYFAETGPAHAGRLVDTHLRAQVMEIMQLEIEDRLRDVWLLVSAPLRASLHALARPEVKITEHACFSDAVAEAVRGHLATVKTTIHDTLFKKLSGLHYSIEEIESWSLEACGDWLVAEVTNAVISSMSDALRVDLEWSMEQFSTQRAQRMGHDVRQVVAGDLKLVRNLVARVNRQANTLGIAQQIVREINEPEEYAGFTRVLLELQYLDKAVAAFRLAQAYMDGVYWIRELRAGQQYVCMDLTDFQELKTHPSAIILRKLTVWCQYVADPRGENSSPAIRRLSTIRRLFEQHTPCINEQWGATLRALDQSASKINLPLLCFPVAFIGLNLALAFAPKPHVPGDKEDHDIFLEVKIAIAIVQFCFLLILGVVASVANSSSHHRETFRRLFGIKRDSQVLPDCAQLLVVLKRLGILSNHPIHVYRGSLLPSTFHKLTQYHAVTLAPSWGAASFSIIKLPEQFDAEEATTNVRYSFKVPVYVKFEPENMLGAACSALGTSTNGSASMIVSNGKAVDIRQLTVEEAKLSSDHIGIVARVECYSETGAQTALKLIAARSKISLDPVYGQISRVACTLDGEAVHVRFEATVNDHNLRYRAAEALSIRPRHVSIVHKLFDGDKIRLMFCFSDFDDYGTAHSKSVELCSQNPWWFPIQLGVAHLATEKAAAVTEQDPVKCIFWSQLSYEQLVQRVHRQFPDAESTRLQRLLGQDRILCAKDLYESESGLVPGPETILAPLLVSELGLNIVSSDSICRGRHKFTELQSPDDIVSHLY